MIKDLENKPKEALVEDLVRGILDVNQLDLAKANQRKAFFKALEERPALLTKVSKINEDHFFKAAIKKNPEYFVHLSRNQYTNQLAQIYLFSRLTEKGTGEQNEAFEILTQKSLDEKIVFTYSYATAEGDELYYLDEELQVPLSLRSSIMLTIKLNNAVSFIEKVDTHVTQLGEEKIKLVIHDVITNQYKSYINSYINVNHVGFYTLSTSLKAVEAGFIKIIGEAFKPYGISVTDFVIKNIAIPKDIQFKLEDQAFKIRQRRAEVEADAEFARLSLANYEEKLAVQSRYPDIEPSLTEYEKDLALKRYLAKIGRKQDEDLDHSINIKHKAPKADKMIDKPEDIVPDIVPKPNMFKRVYLTLAVIALIISIILSCVNLGIGLIVCGVLTLIFGLIAAFNTGRFANVKIEPSILEDNVVENESNTTNEEA